VCMLSIWSGLLITLPSVSVHVGVDIHIPVVWLVLLSATVGPASTTQTTAMTPISTLASMNTQVQAMTSNAPSSVDMSLDNVSSNTSTTTIIIPTLGPTVSAMPTVALSNTNQTTGMCLEQ
jgi:curli biogenesis system outer membrane secretion channel CsgG